MLSFIIPAWNEEEHIGATIESIHTSAQGCEYEYEIVVADDASDDKTAEIAKSLGAIVVHCNNRQIGATRNAGASASSGEYFIFVDADTVICESVVRETVEAFDKGVVAGGSFPTFDGKVPILAYIISQLLRLIFLCCRLSAGAYLFCTREAFEAVGGFDETYYASEEVVLVRQLHQHGSFKTIRSRAVTSGRKLRTYSALELFWILFHLGLPGAGNLQKRHSIWYGPRRPDNRK